MAERERVVVVFDAVSDPAAFAQVAASLAQAMNAELYGVFLEEADSLAMAELPFTSVVDTRGQLRPLGKETLEAAWRAAASKARERLNRAAEQAHLPWAFVVMRGRLAAAMQQSPGARATLVGSGRRTTARAAPVVVASSQERASAITNRIATLLPAGPMPSVCLLEATARDPAQRAMELCELRHPPLLILSTADPLWGESALEALRKQATLPILVLEA